MDLWDSSAELLWDSGVASTSEDSHDSLPPPMWASAGPQTVSYWNTNEDTVQFGDFYSQLEVEQSSYGSANDEDGGVLVESCLSSSSSNSNSGHNHADGPVKEEEVNENLFEGDDEEKQLEFFQVAVKKEQNPATEETKASSVAHLLVKIDAIRNNDAADSVVSTPDIVDEVITLEDERLFQQHTFVENFREVSFIKKGLLFTLTSLINNFVFNLTGR